LFVCGRTTIIHSPARNHKEEFFHHINAHIRVAKATSFDLVPICCPRSQTRLKSGSAARVSKWGPFYADIQPPDFGETKLPGHFAENGEEETKKKSEGGKKAEKNKGEKNDFDFFAFLARRRSVAEYLRGILLSLTCGNELEVRAGTRLRAYAPRCPAPRSLAPHQQSVAQYYCFRRKSRRHDCFAPPKQKPFSQENISTPS